MSTQLAEPGTRPRPDVTRPPLTLGLLATVSCTALGPMPAVTGVSSVPAARPELEFQAGVVPGYYLSSSVQEEQDGTSIQQVALTIEPDRWISLPGLVAGFRHVGAEEAGPSTEPMVGYRSFLGDGQRLALSGIGFGTYASGESRGAAYSAVRAGLEAGIDLRLTPPSKWFELHVFAATSLTGLSAEGTYCVGVDGKFGVDCAEPPDLASPTVSATASGFYPNAGGGIGIDFGRSLDSFFHGGRLSVNAAAGTMPRVVSGEQESAATYSAGGVLLSLRFGPR